MNARFDDLPFWIKVAQDRGLRTANFWRNWWGFAPLTRNQIPRRTK